jgi:hypothetical protein
MTWLMFYLAVLTGFGAFLFSGLATYNQIWVILMPAVPGMLTMLVAFIFFCRRFSSINPGWDAIKSCFSTSVDVKEPDDGVVGQLVESNAFWEKLQRTLGAPPGSAQPPGVAEASSSATALAGAAKPTRQPSSKVLGHQQSRPGSSSVTRRSATPRRGGNVASSGGGGGSGGVASGSGGVASGSGSCSASPKDAASGARDQGGYSGVIQLVTQ